jgi:hypothetical protein
MQESVPSVILILYNFFIFYFKIINDVHVSATCFSSLTLFQADQICYAVLCVFSYVAAGQDRGKLSAEHKTVRKPAGSHLASGGISPRGPLYSDRPILQQPAQYK